MLRLALSSSPCARASAWMTSANMAVLWLIYVKQSEDGWIISASVSLSDQRRGAGHTLLKSTRGDLHNTAHSHLLMISFTQIVSAHHLRAFLSWPKYWLWNPFTFLSDMPGMVIKLLTSYEIWIRIFAELHFTCSMNNLFTEPQPRCLCLCVCNISTTINDRAVDTRLCLFVFFYFHWASMLWKSVLRYSIFSSFHFCY